MNDSKNSLTVLAYFIVGLLVLIIAVQILGVVLKLITQVAAVVLSIVLVLAVGYVVYLLIRNVLRSL